LGDVFKKLESAMAIPASQVPFYLTKALSDDKHLSPAIPNLLAKLKSIDPMTQRNTMNQIRYVGNAGIYESVVAPVLFGKNVDTVMLGNMLFNISEDKCEEPEEGTVDESFVDVCRAFAQTKISESGALNVSDEKDNSIDIDESAEGGLVLTLNKNITIPVDEAKAWQTELLGMQVSPGAIGLVEKLCENLETITSMDNIMSLQSKTGGGYSMYFIKQGSANHMITIDKAVGAAAIQKNITVKEAVAAAQEAFGIDVSKFFDENGTTSANENAELDAEYTALKDELDGINASIDKINNSDDEVKADSTVQDLLKELEESKAELTSKIEQVQGQMASAAN